MRLCDIHHDIVNRSEWPHGWMIIVLCGWQDHSTIFSNGLDSAAFSKIRLRPHLSVGWTFDVRDQSCMKTISQQIRDRENLWTPACGGYDAYIGFKGRKSRKDLGESKTANSISALSRICILGNRTNLYSMLSRDSMSTFLYSSMLMSFMKLFRNCSP